MLHPPVLLLCVWTLEVSLVASCWSGFAFFLVMRFVAGVFGTLLSLQQRPLLPDDVIFPMIFLYVPYHKRPVNIIL